MIENLTKSEMKTLMYFISNPESEVHIRGLAGEIESSYSTVRDSLEKLREKGYLEYREEGNLKKYAPSREKFRKIKQVINIKQIKESGLVEYLEKELRPETIVLFGSYLEGRDKQGSDIDLAVIGGRSKELDLSDFEEELGREVQLTRVRDLKEESSEFKNTLANGLVLQGYLEVV